MFDVYQALKLASVYKEISTITIIDEEIIVHQVEAKDPLDKVLVNQELEGDMDAKEIITMLDSPKQAKEVCGALGYSVGSTTQTIH